MSFRSNNIGVLPPTPPPASNRQTLCLVKYHKSGYFGMMDQYVSSGWKDCGEYLEYKKMRLEKRLFLDEESHYVLAFVHLDEHEDSPRLESVEDRPAYLEPSDHQDFFKAYQKANHYLITGKW